MPIEIKELHIRVAVNADGHTFSPVVWTSCGYHSIDTNLLSFVKAARFNPIRAGNPIGLPAHYALTFGNFVFRWSLVPAAETNRPSAKP